MRVGIGYSENPDTLKAGVQAAKQAMQEAQRSDTCDFVMLFSTSRHNEQVLYQAVTLVFGTAVPIVGGGAVGAISNASFGYAGDQIILAAFWLESVRCDILVENGLLDGEEEVGLGLGKKLATLDIDATSPALLFYDAINRRQDEVHLLMATPLLRGIGQGLGFFPNLVGAGLQGDYACTPIRQWGGSEIVQHSALMLAFSKDVRMDSAIMHGCRPMTGYYTVTKADKQAILEINGQPALRFIDTLLESAIAPEYYAFFLIFGVNKGDKWGAFNEKNYVNRLCLSVDKKREAIIMFEPDMVEGTEFQIMHRSLDLEYMQPKIEQLFADLDGRRPVFSLYINCAGRAAGYAGMDMEDAVVVQKTVANRVPLLGIYTGVEIATVGQTPRCLDWTGVFALFSVPA